MKKAQPTTLLARINHAQDAQEGCFLLTSYAMSVFGLIDHTHTSATQLLNNAVTGDGFANHVVNPEIYV